MRFDLIASSDAKSCLCIGPVPSAPGTALGSAQQRAASIPAIGEAVRVDRLKIETA